MSRRPQGSIPCRSIDTVTQRSELVSVDDHFRKILQLPVCGVIKWVNIDKERRLRMIGNEFIKQQDLFPGIPLPGGGLVGVILRNAVLLPGGIVLRLGLSLAMSRGNVANSEHQYRWNGDASHFGPSFFCSHLGLDGAIPLESARQAFLKAHLRVVIKTFPRLRDVRLGVADVSITGRLVLRLESLAGNFSKLAKDFIEGNALAHSDVENFSGSAVQNLASPPEYGELGSCRGPKILK